MKSNIFASPIAIIGLLTLSCAGINGCQARSSSALISGDVGEAQGWRAELIVAGLEHPWSIAWLPDGSALVTERAGRLRLIRDGSLEPRPIDGVPPVFAVDQGGLMDISLHPDFADNQLIYLTLSIGDPDANRTALARGRLDGHALQEVEILFQNADTKSGPQHFGSRMLWLPDHSLLMSIGDGGNPPTAFAGENIRDQAQNPATHFGSIVRLNDDGSAYAANPFASQPGARAELWTLGHRNIQGLTRDPVNGAVWATEHGSRGGDELNLIAGGNNYGWPEVSYSNEYWGPPVADQTSRPDITDPKRVWTPSKAPSGLTVYSGSAFPQWQGDLFSGALKFQHIRRIRLHNERVVGEEKLSVGERVRDLRQGPDGYLYVLTDEADGKLLRIIPTDE